jgi:hypothetical protein
MKRTLHEHIVFLEQTVQSLRDDLTRTNLSTAHREELNTELATAELALVHYRTAYELEEQMAAGPSAPPQKQTPAPSQGASGDKVHEDRSGSHGYRRPFISSPTRPTRGQARGNTPISVQRRNVRRAK